MRDYTFGNFICQLRTEKGLSQTQLGDMLGVTNKAVSKWENGTAKPNTSLLPKIAEILGVTVEELFAAKRFEKDSEALRLKQFLLERKNKYAKKSAVFFSLLCVIPLLIIEFVCIIIGFKLPDDVIGPLFSGVSVLGFVVCLICFLHSRWSFKSIPALNDVTHSDSFVKGLKSRMNFFGILDICLFMAIPALYFALLLFCKNLKVPNIILAVLIFIFIVSTGILICLAKLKRLLNIKFERNGSARLVNICLILSAEFWLLRCGVHIMSDDIEWLLIVGTVLITAATLIALFKTKKK